MAYNQENKQKQDRTGKADSRQGKPREWREAAKQKRNPVF